MVIINNRFLCIMSDENTEKYNRFCKSHKACFRCICKGFNVKSDQTNHIAGGTYLVMNEEEKIEIR